MTHASHVLPVGKLPAELLERLIGGLPNTDPSVVVGPGIGCDAAAISLGDVTLVVKTDPITFATDSAAHYLVNVNANDLACLGAVPKWMLVTALLPEGKTTERLVESLFNDLQISCTERGISLVGGHTEVTAGLDRPLLVGQLLGVAPTAKLVRPGQGKPGDRLLLTKSIAIEGTALLARECRTELEKTLGQAVVERAADLLANPGISVVPDAQAILSVEGATALHDPTEGGFAMGVRELAHASNCGVVVNRDLIPVLPETIAIATHFGIDPLGMLASGSLLAAVSPSAMTEIEMELRRHGIEFAWIGKLTAPERGFTLISNGEANTMPSFVADEVTRALSHRSD